MLGTSTVTDGWSPQVFGDLPQHRACVAARVGGVPHAGEGARVGLRFGTDVSVFARDGLDADEGVVHLEHVQWYEVESHAEGEDPEPHVG
jgi:hypothetical protein